MTISFWAVGLVCGFLAFAVAQVIVVARYCRYMKLAPLPASRPAGSPVPTCAVLIALRGADTNLETTLRAHLDQRDVQHHLHLIVDSLLDPAVEIVQRLPISHPVGWTLHVVDLNSDRCSLKCLGLAQVAKKLLAQPEVPQYFAFADSDGVVPRDWLVRLLQPLQAESDERLKPGTIGASTGHRWYLGRASETSPIEPSASSAGEFGETSWGSLVRYFWNLGSLPQMHLYQVVWGGSWAIRREVFRVGGLIEAWEQALFEDTMVAGKLRAAGFRTVTAPGLLVQSYEPLNVVAATGWIGRQLLDVRLYHDYFFLTALHAWLLAGLLGGAVVVGIGALACQDYEAAAWILGAVLGYQLVYVVIWAWLQATADRCLAGLEYDRASSPGLAGGPRPRASMRRTPLSAGGWRLGWRYFGGLLLTQGVYPLATLRALAARRVSWRGIDYRLTSSGTVQRLNYVAQGDDRAPRAMQEQEMR